MKKITFYLLFLYFLSLSNFCFSIEKYFSSFLKSEPRITVIVYKNEVIFQNLLNKRYVYTIPYDGKYTLQTGRKLSIKSGQIQNYEMEQKDSLDYLIVRFGKFFTEKTEIANELKFRIAKNLFATDCNLNFDQYQIIPQYPEIVRAIIVNENELYSIKNCYPKYGNIQDLIKEELRIEDAIQNVQEIQDIEKSGKITGTELTYNQKSELKSSQKTIIKYKTWEFGINARNVILGDYQNKNLNGNLIGFYITSFNDIGLLPEKIKLASEKEFIKYKDLFIDNFDIVSEIEGEKEEVFINSENGKIIQYKKDLLQSWRNDIKNKKFNEAKLTQ